MEAERINQLNNQLNDLEQRSTDIRDYMDYQGKKDRLEEVIPNCGTTPNARRKSAKSAKFSKASSSLSTPSPAASKTTAC